MIQGLGFLGGEGGYDRMVAQGGPSLVGSEAHAVE